MCSLDLLLLIYFLGKSFFFEVWKGEEDKTLD